MLKKRIFILQQSFNIIGGIETAIINWCKTFCNEYDITLICEEIGIDNAIAISKYCNIIKTEEIQKDIECDIKIQTSSDFNPEIFRRIKTKKLCHEIHCDWMRVRPFWKDVPLPNYDKNATFIAVSESAGESFEKLTGNKCVVIPNILIKENIQKPLRLMSATRLTEEKGYERMKILCDLFEKYKIPYVWDVFCTNVLNKYPYKNMFLCHPRENIQQTMKCYDYVVQLSSTDSFCFTMYEALMQEVPVLVTPFPNAVQEVKNGINGYVLPFDMKLSKEQVEKIYRNIPTQVKYEQKGVKELWKKILE